MKREEILPPNMFIIISEIREDTMIHDENATQDQCVKTKQKQKKPKNSWKLKLLKAKIFKNILRDRLEEKVKKIVQKTEQENQKDEK